ncbi:hypothetical protein [Marinimicrobium agarilyticum]|uniref:hypothetical protein n=1 Tax=Marinimicrobium agarilyticum TaxID=306546 RepID=UPI000424C796|nr:hypothetical protein [Marinimicrobium agarilyticum]
MSCFIANASLLVAVRRLSVSTVVALTLLLAACGGGGGSESSRLDNKSPYTEKPSSGNSTDGGTSGEGAGDDEAEQDSGAETPDSNAGNDTPDTDRPGTETPDESPGTDSGENVTGDSGEDTPNPDTSEPDAGDDAVVDGGDAEPDTGTDEPDAGEDSGLIEEVVSEVDGDVLLQWYRPRFRENGDPLGDDEIDGYELRYRQLGEEDFQTVIIEDGWDEEYELGKLVGSYQFSIAAYDNNGLYSEFVSLSPVTGLLGSL